MRVYKACTFNPTLLQSNQINPTPLPNPMFHRLFLSTSSSNLQSSPFHRSDRHLGYIDSRRRRGGMPWLNDDGSIDDLCEGWDGRRGEDEEIGSDCCEGS